VAQGYNASLRAYPEEKSSFQLPLVVGSTVGSLGG
jgi:hypothetical protein